MAVHIGTSGWSYDHWNGVLYPPGTPSKDRLAWYVQRYETVEVNYTFYRWPPPATFADWKRRTPDGFLMTVKASRGLTHAAKLNQPERWLARMEAGLNALGEKCGVLLVQLPPDFEYDFARLEYFLERLLPAQKTAIEFRHSSWNREETFVLLEQRGVAYCVMSGAGLPCLLRATAPFVYVRFHGPHPDSLYAGSYSDNDLRWWADRIREWTGQGRDVFAYFNNDGEGNAIRNADTLKAILG